VDDDLDFVRTLRRTLHRHPELGHQEKRTADTVEGVLRDLGLTPFRPAPTSVAALAGPPATPPAIGFRADLDALPLLERTGAAYASRAAGVMHACGHDGHTAALLGLARRLIALPPEHPVLLIFQQAEETDPSGAPLVLDGLHPDMRPPRYVAFHLWPELPVGVIGLRTGPVLASVAGLAVKVAGAPGRQHGTRTDNGSVDALHAGVQLYQAVRAAWPATGRHPSVGVPTAVTLNQLEGGAVPNRPAMSCEIRGAIRSLSFADEHHAVRALETIAAAVARETGARIDVEVRSGIRPPVTNDAETVAIAREACRLAGLSCVDYPPGVVGVSDDFGWFQESAAGALVFAGCGTGDHPVDLHDPGFDFDEAALVGIVEVSERMAHRADRRKTSPPAAR
jgi:amidohydrolase